MIDVENFGVRVGQAAFKIWICKLLNKHRPIFKTDDLSSKNL